MSSQPPHNLEAERALLGAIVINCDVLDRVENILGSNDFFEPVHRFIYSQFIKAREEGRRTFFPLLRTALANEVKEAKISGMTASEYLMRIVAEATTILSARDFARMIAEDSDRRRLIAIAEGLVLAASSGKDTVCFLATDTIEQFDEIAARHRSQHVTAVSAGRAAEASIQRMRLALMNPGKITGVTTGILALDNLLNGWQRGELIVLAGRPGMGKSAFIVSSIRQAAELGVNAHFFSLEMSAEEIADRMLADTLYHSRNGIQYFDIPCGRLNDNQAKQIIEAQQVISDLPIKIETEGGLNVSQIACRARRHKQWLEQRGRTLDLVVIDHLHIMRASNRYAGNRVAEVTEISAALKTLAKELNVPVVVAAQLNRQVEARDDKRPTLADLRDSGSIEQDADAILFLYRESYYLQARLSERNADERRVDRLANVLRKLEINVAKHRAGPTGMLELFLDLPCNALRDQEPCVIARNAE